MNFFYFIRNSWSSIWLKIYYAFVASDLYSLFLYSIHWLLRRWQLRWEDMLLTRFETTHPPTRAQSPEPRDGVDFTIFVAFIFTFSSGASSCTGVCVWFAYFCQNLAILTQSPVQSEAPGGFHRLKRQTDFIDWCPWRIILHRHLCMIFLFLSKFGNLYTNAFARCSARTKRVKVVYETGFQELGVLFPPSRALPAQFVDSRAPWGLVRRTAWYRVFSENIWKFWF